MPSPLRLFIAASLCFGLSISPPARAAERLASSPADANQLGQALLSWARDPDVQQVAYDPRLDAAFWPDGASGANREWERGRWSRWYVDEQERGASLLVMGVVRQQPQAIDDGKLVLDWALSHQAPDGSFSGSGDEVHSTAVFLAALCQGGLVLAASPAAASHQADLARYRVSAARAAGWLFSSHRLPRELLYMAPFGDQVWTLATAGKFAATFTGDPAIARAVEPLVGRALALQGADGQIGEGGGYDSEYQAVALQMAELCALQRRTQGLDAAPMLAFVRKGLAWERTRIATDGALLVEGNTRTAGEERDHLGHRRRVSPRAVALAFLYGALLTGDVQDRAVAQLVMNGDR